jgi:hypothetical protein
MTEDEGNDARASLRELVFEIALGFFAGYTAVIIWRLISSAWS